MPPRVRRILIPLGIFTGARLAQLVVTYIAHLMDRSQEMGHILARWDGVWYLSVARSGYPDQVIEGSGNAVQNNLGFFPVFPLLIRTVDRLSPMGEIASAVAIATLCGAVFSVVLWALVRRLCDEGTATRSVVLMSFSPSAFVFGMAYSEPLLLMLAAICFWALFAERWVLAGGAAAIASASRPNGFVLAACCLWAAVVAFRRNRKPLPFIAPLLAPMGLLAFFAFLQRRTGDPLAYVKTQANGWGQGFDAGWSTAKKVAGVASHPLQDFNLLCSALSVVVIAVCAWFLWRWRPPFVLVIYTVGILGLALTSTSLTSTARFFMTAFPLTIALARKLDGPAYGAVVGVSATLMATLFILSSQTILYAP